MYVSGCCFGTYSRRLTPGHARVYGQAHESERKRSSNSLKIKINPISPRMGLTGSMGWKVRMSLNGLAGVLRSGTWCLRHASHCRQTASRQTCRIYAETHSPRPSSRVPERKRAFGEADVGQAVCLSVNRRSRGVRHLTSATFRKGYPTQLRAKNMSFHASTGVMWNCCSLGLCR